MIGYRRPPSILGAVTHSLGSVLYRTMLGECGLVGLARGLGGFLMRTERLTRIG